MSVKWKSLKWVNTKAGRIWLEKNSGLLVFIKSDNGFWMKGGAGYTDIPSKRGIYTLAEAFSHTSHCGPEKQVHYIPVTKEYFRDTIPELAQRLSYLITKQTEFLTPTNKTVNNGTE
jgi:hypothetical protein